MDSESLCPVDENSTQIADKPKYLFKGVIHILLLVSLTLGLFCYENCLRKHFCMGGHMEHPPYDKWEYVSDTLSIVMLLLSLVFCFLLVTLCRGKWVTKGLLVVMGLIIIYFVVGRFRIGMMPSLIDLLFFLYLALCGIISLIMGIVNIIKGCKKHNNLYSTSLNDSAI